MSILEIRSPYRVLEVRVPGPQGPAGASGSAGSSYIHTQAAPSDTWIIPHNLGFIPATELFTTGMVEFQADVVHIDLNNTQVLLAMPMAGSARLN